MIVGVILAAGKGTRMNLDSMNKTALEFNGKPLICYGVDLFSHFCQEVLIVVGAYAHSVKEAVGENSKVGFVDQINQEGTGHAVKVAISDLQKRGVTPKQILVGYGDHMMFYPQIVVESLVSLQQEKKAVAALVTCDAPNPFGLGRVIRDNQGEVRKFIEEKDATEEERRVKEINAGLYCFDFEFLVKNLDNLTRSPVTGEYYINDFVDLGMSQTLKVSVLKVPFEYVGIGVNTKEQVEESKKLHKRLNFSV